MHTGWAMGNGWFEKIIAVIFIHRQFYLYRNKGEKYVNSIYLQGNTIDNTIQFNCSLHLPNESCFTNTNFQSF